MISNSNCSNCKTSLNDAFELIIKVFNEERLYYEKTINSLREKVTELENSLIKAKKENYSYQTKISKLKGKLRSISKTVSRLEESDFDSKIEKKNSDKDLEKNELNGININNNNFNTIKYKNNDTNNSFRKNSKLIQDKNKSTSINNNSNHHYIKMNLLDNDKLNNNREDINRINIKKTHKKTLSTKIKNSILYNVHESHMKKKNEDNSLFKSHCFNDEDVSFFLMNNYNENDMKSKNTFPIDRDKKMRVKKKKHLGRDKYNKIEQKIKGLKSALSIYNKHDKLNSTESYNSLNF